METDYTKTKNKISLHNNETAHTSIWAQAFKLSIPVLGAYWFLGITYGLLAAEMGYSIWIPIVMATVIYSGSVEFLALTLLLGTFHPFAAFVMAFCVGARHLFYGITMLERYRGTGWRKPFLIYWLTDETFAINYSLKIHNQRPDVTPKIYLLISVLDFIYWITGGIIGYSIGRLLGESLLKHLEGLDFVVTAMFVAIFMDDYIRNKTTHLSSWLGIACAGICLVLFGPDQFIIPTMMALLLMLYIVYRRSILHPHRNNVSGLK